MIQYVELRRIVAASVKNSIARAIVVTLFRTEILFYNCHKHTRNEVVMRGWGPN